MYPSMGGMSRMRREDFSNPIDWIIYKVNGEVRGDKPQGRESHLRFYHDTEDRCSVWHNKDYLCMCDKHDKSLVEKEFNRLYNGRNFAETQKIMKKAFNKSTRNRRRKSDISFIMQKSGRMHVRAKKGRKRKNLCSCEPSQKEEILARYNQMKKNGLSFDEIRVIFQNDYNLKRVRNKDEHIFKISNNGTIYKDGSFIKVNKDIYKMIEEELK